MGYKYPYIADKKLYAAVMGACKWIRESGYFNKAVAYYADKYGVDEERLANEIRKRQAAGQKGKTSANKGKKIKWFIVAKTSFCDANPIPALYGRPKIVKGFDSEAIKRRFYDLDTRETVLDNYGGNYASVFSHDILGNKNGYETQAEAESVLSVIIESKKKYLYELVESGLMED